MTRYVSWLKASWTPFQTTYCALKDNQISDEEFRLILNKAKRNQEMKAEIRARAVRAHAAVKIDEAGKKTPDTAGARRGLCRNGKSHGWKISLQFSKPPPPTIHTLKVTAGLSGPPYFLPCSSGYRAYNHHSRPCVYMLPHSWQLIPGKLMQASRMFEHHVYG